MGRCWEVARILRCQEKPQTISFSSKSPTSLQHNNALQNGHWHPRSRKSASSKPLALFLTMTGTEHGGRWSRLSKHWNHGKWTHRNQNSRIPQGETRSKRRTHSAPAALWCTLILVSRGPKWGKGSGGSLFCFATCYGHRIEHEPNKHVAQSISELKAG